MEVRIISKFKFIKDYTILDVNIKSGSVLRVIDYEVVDDNGIWLFDLDSPIANEYGYKIT